MPASLAVHLKVVGVSFRPVLRVIDIPFASTAAMATVIWSVAPRTGRTTSVSVPLFPAVKVCAAQPLASSGAQPQNRHGAALDWLLWSRTAPGAIRLPPDAVPAA